VRRALQEKQLLHLRRLAEGHLARKVEELARSNADLEAMGSNAVLSQKHFRSESKQGRSRHRASHGFGRDFRD
jgi:hypothetical protein